jgi:hypothetical protein
MCRVRRGNKIEAMVRPSDTDRILDWRDEWRRIEDQLGDLPTEARKAVLRLVESFRAEDSARRDRAA